jgi:hypothetical protein
VTYPPNRNCGVDASDQNSNIQLFRTNSSRSRVDASRGMVISKLPAVLRSRVNLALV